jgi:hypothetical protein
MGEADRNAERGIGQLDERDDEEVRARLASSDPFAGRPDLFVVDWLLTRTELVVTERDVRRIVGHLGDRWTEAVAGGAAPTRRGRAGGSDHRWLEVSGAIVLEELAMRESLTPGWVGAIVGLVVMDVPGAWFDRAVTTLADNRTLPGASRLAVLQAARRTELSGFHPHMMGPDYAHLLSRVPHRMAGHEASMTDELLDALLAGAVDDELLRMLQDRPELSAAQRGRLAGLS